jgi:DNA processing protein
MGRRASHRYVAPEEAKTATLREILGRRACDGAQQVLGFARDQITKDRLWYAGDLSLIKARTVAVVGSREASPEGSARARRLARELAQAGVVVVSGLARGIDTEALTSTIETGGRVIAVLGTPLDRVTPVSNASLQERIYREHLLVSQFAPGSRVHPGNFPRRNRLMAAMSDATVIVEASDKSGALHQAAECRRLDRWLFIAKSLTERTDVTWPAQWLKYERTVVMKTTQDVLDVLA